MIVQACKEVPLSSAQLLKVSGDKSRPDNFKKSTLRILKKKLPVKTIPHIPGEQMALPLDGNGSYVCPHTGEKYQLDNGKVTLCR